MKRTLKTRLKHGLTELDILFFEGACTSYFCTGVSLCGLVLNVCACYTCHYFYASGVFGWVYAINIFRALT